MPDEPIRGWKDIAKYLHTSERSAQRWERTLRLPIRRMGSDRGSVVCAFPAELDEWRRSAASLSLDAQHDDEVGRGDSPAESQPASRDRLPLRRLRRRGILLLLTVVLGVAIAAWLLTSRVTRPQAGQTRTPSGAAMVFLVIQAPNGVNFRAAIPDKTTGAMDVPGRPRILLSPILGGDTLHVRINTVDRNGTTRFVGDVDLKRNAKASVNEPYQLELEWVGVAARPAAAPVGGTAGR